MTIEQFYNGRGSARVQFQISPKNKREKRLSSAQSIHVSPFNMSFYMFFLGSISVREEGGLHLLL